MEKIYSFVCDAANIANTGNINALGIFTKICSQQFPCRHQTMTYIASLFAHENEKGIHQAEISFIDDDGRIVIPKIQATVNVQEFGLVQPFIVTIGNAVFVHPGTYQIDLSIDHQNICSNQIIVDVLNPTQNTH